MEQTPLGLIEQDLREEGFGTHHLVVDADNQYERLLVMLGRDEHDRDYFLQLTFVNDIMNVLGQPDQPENAYLLQFSSEFPFKIKIESFAEAARLLLTLNRILPVGALGLSEADQTLNYNYVLVLPDREVDDVVVTEIVDIAMFFIRNFAPLIEAVTTGTRSREEVVEELKSKDLLAPPITQSSAQQRPVIIQG